VEFGKCVLVITAVPDTLASQPVVAPVEGVTCSAFS
jgi:hypothetical protein